MATRVLSADDIREVGFTLYGEGWQAEIARQIGVPRQSVAAYLKAGGVRATQATAIIGLVARARMALQRDHATEVGALVRDQEAALATIDGLLDRLEGRVER